MWNEHDLRSLHFDARGFTGNFHTDDLQWDDYAFGFVNECYAAGCRNRDVYGLADDRCYYPDAE
jgi:hypothetical protein